MRARATIAALLLLLLTCWSAGARGESNQSGNVRIIFDGGFTPHSLPRDHLAPVTASVAGTIATTDGTHPPALRRLQIAINRNAKFFSRGLPTCPSAILQSTSSDSALAACRRALIGHGNLRADVSFSGQSAAVANGTILAFNSRQNGHPS